MSAIRNGNTEDKASCIECVKMDVIDDNDNTVEKKEGIQDNSAKDVKVNKFKLSIYMCLVLVPFGLLISMAFSSIFEYSRWPIYTETNIKPQHEVNFPAITFCPAHNGYKLNILKVSVL